MKKSRVLIIFLACAVLGTCGLYRAWDITFSKNLIPAEIGISRTILIDGKSGGLEGCGVAIFQLDQSTLQRIQNTGVSALKEANHSRKKKFLRDDFQEYAPWVETPYIETGNGMTLADRWLGGFTCAEIDVDLSNSIYRALKEAKSYYALTNEAGLIVIPSLGLVIYSYFG